MKSIRMKMKIIRTIPTLFLGLLMVLLTSTTPWAIGSAVAATDNNSIKMAHFEDSLNDKVSLQHGAKLFVNYCLSCHSAKYMRYNRMAKDLEIPTDLVEKHMMFTTDKIGDPMQTTMPAEYAKQWFGVTPPDLSLVGRLRGPEWLYNYFRTFYLDENSPSGWNNMVYENVAMPHAMHELQGQQRAIFKTVIDADGNETKVLDRFETVTLGKMTVEEYDHAIRDLTNFLVYVGEPAKMSRINYGIWVMMFFALLIMLTYLLKKEYWRDIH